MHTGISRASRALKATAIAKWIADDRMPTCEVPPDLWAEQPRLQEIVSCIMPLGHQPMVQIPGEPLRLFLWRLRPARGSLHSLAPRRTVFVFVLR